MISPTTMSRHWTPMAGKAYCSGSAAVAADHP